MRDNTGHGLEMKKTAGRQALRIFFKLTGRRGSQHMEVHFEERWGVWQAAGAWVGGMRG